MTFARMRVLQGYAHKETPPTLGPPYNVPDAHSSLVVLTRSI